jgi:hypothetical protein
MTTQLSRREVLAAMAVASVVPPAIVKRHDLLVESLLKRQITNPANRWCGGYADEFDLCEPHAAGGILEAFAGAFVCPQSQFHKDRLLVERMRLAARHLEARQNEYGNVDLLVTNFNSPPDTGFVVHPVGTAARVASLYGERELVGLMERFLKKAGAALAAGGVHTPNHRWVVAAALAQIHELFPDPHLVRRIDQWLAEGIDIDEDGQFTERSTTVYNPICDRALVVLAAKQRRPELLDPVRRNLNAMLYLLHPGYEVVTEISRRQDVNQRRTMAPYWFPLQYLAVHDGNGQFATLAQHFPPEAAHLTSIMEYPELAQAGPRPAAIPEDYERQMPSLGIARIRRGATSATLLLGGSSRFLTLRRGQAVINAVRFASAFFGKGQFVPSLAEKRGDGYHFAQSLEAGYVQPLDPARLVAAGEWNATRSTRRQSEICRLEQSAVVTEMKHGFRVRLEARGTMDVPVAVEINLRAGGKLDGCTRAPKVEDGWILAAGQATYRAGSRGIRFGPGSSSHQYTQVRGAEPKLPGPSVYITGYTPFDHTLEFTWA